MAETFAGTNTELGGMLAAAPARTASSLPSGCSPARCPPAS